MSLQRVVRIVAWVLAAAILVLSLVPSVLRPETSIPHKLEHLLIFVATGVAFGIGYEARRGLLAIELVIFAGGVEIAQLFVPGRHARLSDFLVDAAGICAGSSPYLLLNKSALHSYATFSAKAPLLSQTLTPRAH